MLRRYCSKCRKMVEAKSYGAGEFCSECFNYFDGSPGVMREMGRYSGLSEVELREGESSIDDIAEQQASLEDSFSAMGLSEAAAKQAAKGRTGLGEATMRLAEKRRALSDDAIVQASLEDSFRALGLSKSDARQAAKGRK